MGMAFSYAEQPKPEGLAQAFIIGADFVAGGPSCLILGDNIFHGQDLVGRLNRARALEAGAHIFAIRVSDPSGYGIIDLL